PDWGLIAPRGHVLPLNPDSYYWGSNVDRVLSLAQSAGLAVGDIAELEFSFVGGSMFWFRPQALAPVLDAKLVTEQFDVEEGQRDGTLAHAVDRFIGLAVKHAGFTIAESDSLGVQPSEVSVQLRLLLEQTKRLDDRVQALSQRIADQSPPPPVSIQA